MISPRASEPVGRLTFWLGLVIAVGCAVYATEIRFAQLATWKERASAYFPDGVPAMTTVDAYYPLRWARAYLAGTYHPEADDALRHHQTLQLPAGASEYFPDGKELDWRARREPKRLPGLSFLLAVLQPVAGSVEYAGLYLIPILANLFIVPLFLYAWRIGYPAAGVMGGLVATFSVAYYARTSPGWVDTDCLNLFFPWMASLFVLCMNRSQKKTTSVLLSAALGVTLYLYFLWYERPAFAYLYWGTLAIHLALQRMRPGFILLCVATCVVCSHPLQVAMGGANLALLASRYLNEANPVARFSLAAQWFPDVMQTVSELLHGDWKQSFAFVLTRPAPVIVGTLAFAVLAAVRWRQSVPLLPLLGIAGLALVRGPRFAMYLAPFAGLGLGAVVELAVRGFTARMGSGRRSNDRAGEAIHSPSIATRVATTTPKRQLLAACVAHVAVLAVFFAGVKPMTGIGHINRPAVGPETVIALRELAKTLPPGSALWTWWDYGYAIPYLAGLAVYHDGGGQFTPQTNVIANSLVIGDELALRNSIRFVDRFGNSGIDRVARAVGNRDALLAELGRYAGSTGGDRDVFLLFTSNMVRAFGAMRYASGLPMKNERGGVIAYDPLACTGLQGNILTCHGFDIDLASGVFTDGRTVDRFVSVVDGHVVHTTEYAVRSGFVLQLLESRDGRQQVVRLPDEVYRSNMNQMYLLGNFDAALFEEVFSRYPTIRLFRVKR